MNIFLALKCNFEKRAIFLMQTNFNKNQIKQIFDFNIFPPIFQLSWRSHIISSHICQIYFFGEKIIKTKNPRFNIR